MPTLHVRNVPEELYERLRQRAAAENRSLSAEVMTLLAAAIQGGTETDSELFDRIRRRRAHLLNTVGRFPTSVAFLREDRNR